ncbi:hypothetical protein OF83DRAFT_691739 [Amylostereum chailletii]|nr:hypothetical protein OF83DRAFT_691739 [Amylostereum chailletii]
MTSPDLYEPSHPWTFVLPRSHHTMPVPLDPSLTSTPTSQLGFKEERQSKTSSTPASSNLSQTVKTRAASTIPATIKSSRNAYTTIFKTLTGWLL